MYLTELGIDEQDWQLVSGASIALPGSHQRNLLPCQANLPNIFPGQKISWLSFVPFPIADQAVITNQSFLLIL
jgi:hypothetical protein